MDQGTHLRLVRQRLAHLAREAVHTHRVIQLVNSAKGDAICTAIQYGHYLGRWLDDPQHPDHQVATCLQCHAGADVDLGSGDLSMSEQLRETCARRAS